MNVAVLGATGSVGGNALEAVEALGGRIAGISVNSRIDKLCSLIDRYSPSAAVITDEKACREYISVHGSRYGSARILCGKEGLLELASGDDVSTVLNAVSGLAGLEPTLAALKAGKKVATANKESIVMGWHLIKDLISYPGQLMPVDSEHSAVFQLLLSREGSELRKIILTASGGAVYGKSRSELERVTAADCLLHPTWDMGKKITVDSATLMNKGLEVIEASNLFDVGYEFVDVYIHPQSIVHALVEFSDGCVISHMAPADMKIPISYAISYPKRASAPGISLGLDEIARLEFFRPDREKFPCLDIAVDAGRAGGVLPVLLCAADEAAVDFFLKGRIKFTSIPDIIFSVLEKDIKGSLESTGGIEEIYGTAYRTASETAETL